WLMGGARALIFPRTPGAFPAVSRSGWPSFRPISKEFGMKKTAIVQIRRLIESLESRVQFSASANLFVNPPAPTGTSAYQVAPQGCNNGIDPHAQPSSNYVVNCGQGG